MKTLPVTKDKIRLLLGSVNYLGPSALLEFNVMNVTFISKSIDYVAVDILLQRRYFYHLATTYFPTFCLIIITEMLLFINEEHFEAIIMVALTTMLVMYTLHQSISSQLPKTSYMKMIDIWLMFCLTIPFLVFVVEVVLEALRSHRRNQYNNENNVTKKYDTQQVNGLNRTRSIFGKKRVNNREMSQLHIKKINVGSEEL